MRPYFYFYIIRMVTEASLNYGVYSDTACDGGVVLDRQRCQAYCNSVHGRVPLFNKPYSYGTCFSNNCVCQFNYSELQPYADQCTVRFARSSLGNQIKFADRAIGAKVVRMDAREKFAAFKRAYGKTYRTATEEQERLMIFNDNLNKIDSLMARRKGSVVFGVGPYADLTSSEYLEMKGNFQSEDASTGAPRLKPRMLNSNQSWWNQRPRQKSAPAPTTPGGRQPSRSNSVPASFRPPPFGYRGYEPEGEILIDWRFPANLYPPTVPQNQFGRKCGACYIFAAVGAVEILLARAEGKVTQLSHQALVDCDREAEQLGCVGGKIRDSLNYIKNSGIPTAKKYPYEAQNGRCKNIKPNVKIANWSTADQDNLEEHLKYSPIPTNVFAPTILQHYVSGVFDDERCVNDLQRATHAVVIVGHYKDVWILRDSELPTWGLQGHYLLRKGICGIGSRAYQVQGPYQRQRSTKRQRLGF